MAADAQKEAAKSASRRYGEVTHIRFSADELASLKAIAERDGVTVSEVVRRLVRADAGHLPIASEALRPAIVEITDQLRRVGINFNQAVRAMNDGRVAHDEDLEQALIAVGIWSAVPRRTKSDDWQVPQGEGGQAMSGRLAGYAAAIERYLRGGSVVKREDLDDNKSTTSALREAGEFQAMKSYERTGGGGRLGQGRAGSTVGVGSNAPGSSPGGAGAAGSSVSRGPKSTAAASSPRAASAPIMVYGATLAGFRPEEEEEDWKRRGGGGRRGGLPSGTGRAARAGYQARAVAARAGYAAGAQPAVFKVMPNPPSNKEAAARLLNYIGKREDEKGEKHDIEIFDEDGQVLATGGARKAFLETFCETFEPPLEEYQFYRGSFRSGRRGHLCRLERGAEQGLPCKTVHLCSGRTDCAGLRTHG